MMLPKENGSKAVFNALLMDAQWFSTGSTLTAAVAFCISGLNKLEYYVHPVYHKVQKQGVKSSVILVIKTHEK